MVLVMVVIMMLVLVVLVVMVLMTVIVMVVVVVIVMVYNCDEDGDDNCGVDDGWTDRDEGNHDGSVGDEGSS